MPVLGGDLRPNPYAGGDTSFCFVIDSIRTVLYDSVFLETFFQHSLIDDTLATDYSFPVYNWQYENAGHNIPNGAYARKVGGLYEGLLPNRIYSTVAKPTLGDTLEYGDSYGLRCYRDNAVSIHILQPDKEGCYFEKNVNIRTVNKWEDKLTIFPVPSAGVLNIKSENLFPSSSKLSITDLSGRILKYFNLPTRPETSTYRLNDLPAGNYFLVFTIDNAQYFKKIVLTK